MKIIPVIDLLHGSVIRARAGQREQYRPQSSPLCRDTDAPAVVRAMLSLHPFRTVYLADLDAILHTGENGRLIEQLVETFPGPVFWLDSGTLIPDTAQPRVRTVIGSESGITAGELRKFNRQEADFVLSLDFNDSGFIGDGEILVDAGLWPRDVIVMHLPAIGSGAGPALALAQSLAARSRQSRFHLAGGFGSVSDLQRAHAAGMAGALVATLLHECRLNGEDLRKFDSAGD